jgi:hypothetical protein
VESPWDAEDGTALGENCQAAVNNATNNERDVGDEVEEIEEPTDSSKVFLVDYYKRGTTKCRCCKKKSTQVSSGSANQSSSRAGTSSTITILNVRLTPSSGLG